MNKSVEQNDKVKTTGSIFDATGYQLLFHNFQHTITNMILHDKYNI